jgi:hypothetical protein
MKNILMISIILFSFIQSQIIWGQNTWVAKTKVEQQGLMIDYLYNKYVLGEGARKVNTGAETTDYSLTKNPDGISYVLNIKVTSIVNDGSGDREEIKTNNYKIKRVQVRDDAPDELSWYPHEIDGNTYETGQSRYHEICVILETNEKIMIRWLKNPICLSKCYVMEMLFLKKNDSIGTDDISAVVNQSLLFVKKN